jgi:DNA primase
VYGESEEEEPKKVEISLPKTFVPCWKENRRRQWIVPKWLTKDRGVTRETAKEWGLGFVRIDRLYANRLIIPIDCPGGSSFTARDMTGRGKPKYLNPSGISQSRLLFGWNVLPMVGYVILCEGPFDAVKLWQYSFPALALGGKELHEAQFQMLCGAFSKGTKMIVMLDGEEKAASVKVAAKLRVRFNNTRIASLPYGKDPGELSRKVIRRAIRESKKYTGSSRQDYLAKMDQYGYG